MRLAAGRAPSGAPRAVARTSPGNARFVGTPRVGLTTSEYGRDYRVGYGLGVLDRGKLNFELGIDAQRREMPMQGEASNGLMGRGTLGW